MGYNEKIEENKDRVKCKRLLNCDKKAYLRKSRG